MIQIKNISFSYARNEVLKNISFNVQSGECVGILGNNGAGKSTLITCLNKIRTPKTGEIYINNQDVLKMGRLETARRISYVAQKNELSHMTVFDCVLLGRKPYIKWSLSQEDIRLVQQPGWLSHKSCKKRKFLTKFTFFAFFKRLLFKN